MIIQNTNSNQAASPAVVANTSNAQPASRVAVESANPATTVVTTEQLSNAVSVINQVLRQSNNSLEFSVDATTKTPVVRMVDTETGELISQYPSEQTLAISRSIDQYQHQQGLLLKQKA